MHCAVSVDVAENSNVETIPSGSDVVTICIAIA